MIENNALYVVATPIGNLQDLTPRAIEVLTEVDLILCEDTNHSAPLLEAFGIKTPRASLHDHNEKEKSIFYIEKIKNGEKIAIISDAGTPLISDPGYYITTLCHQNNIRVIPIPGASALITALSASGLPTDSFSFYGFLPAKSKKRKEKLNLLKNSQETTIFYESPHRIIESIQDLITVLGADKEICIARELTKQFETIKKGVASEILEYLQENSNHTKGEFVLMISKGEKLTYEVDTRVLSLAKELSTKIKPKEVAKIIASNFNLDKKEIYDFLSKS